MAATKALAYYRRSREDDPNEPGVKQQKQAVAEYAASRGYEIVGEWSDSDRSGWDTDVERPGFDALRASLPSTEATIVLAWAQDRLTRNVGVWGDFVSLAQRHEIERIEYVTGGNVDLDEPGGVFTGSVMASVGQLYSHQLSKNVERGHRALRERGGQNGGVRTFGFRDDVTPYGRHRTDEHDLDEAALIREAAQRLLDGATIRSIAVDWNAREIATASGRGRWTAGTIRRLLLNPKLVGKRRVGSWVTVDKVNPKTGKQLKRYVVSGYVDGAWEPILDQATFDAVGARIEANGKRPQNGRPLQRWLSDFVVCGTCGLTLRGASDDGKPVYRCRPKTDGGCGALQVQAVALEERATSLIRDALDGGLLVRLAAGSDAYAAERATLTTEIDEALARREKLADEVADGLLDSKLVAMADAKLVDRIERSQARLREIAPVTVDVETSLVERAASIGLDSLTNYERREVARIAFERFAVLPAWRRGGIPKGDDLLRGRLDVTMAI